MSFLNPGGGNASSNTSTNSNNYDTSHHDKTNADNAVDDHSYNLGDQSAVDARQSSSTDKHEYNTAGGAINVTDQGALAMVLDFAKNIFGANGGGGAGSDKSAHEYVPGTVAAPMNWKPWAIGGGAVLVVGVVVLVAFKRKKRG